MTLRGGAASDLEEKRKLRTRPGKKEYFAIYFKKDYRKHKIVDSFLIPGRTQTAAFLNF